jgi:hypothetical protein
MEQLDLSNAILIAICAGLALFVILRLAQLALAEESRIRQRTMESPRFVFTVPATPDPAPTPITPFPYTRSASLPPRRPTLPPYCAHTALADPPTLPLPAITPPLTPAPTTRPDSVARLTFQPLVILTVSPNYLRQPYLLN